MFDLSLESSGFSFCHLVKEGFCFLVVIDSTHVEWSQWNGLVCRRCCYHYKVFLVAVGRRNFLSLNGFQWWKKGICDGAKRCLWEGVEVD